MNAGHVGGHLCLVDEDQVLRFQSNLTVEPVVAPAQDVGSVVLDGLPSLLCASSLAARRRDAARQSTWSSRARPGNTQFCNRDILGRLPQGQDVSHPLLKPGGIACRLLVVWGQGCWFPDAAPASGSPSMAQDQIGAPLPGSSCRRQSLPKAAYANPWKAGDRSMPASFTSMDSKSDITLKGNPPQIQNGRKALHIRD